MPFDFEKWLRDDEDVSYDPRYNALPTSMKDIYTPKEYAWLSDQEKFNLMERDTDPDPDEWGA